MNQNSEENQCVSVPEYCVGRLLACLKAPAAVSPREAADHFSPISAERN
jgi:hypothetical protein